MNNYTFVRECCRCFNLLPEHINVSLVWVLGHSSIPENCRHTPFGNLLNRFGYATYLTQVGHCTEILSGVYLSWVNEKLLSTAKLTWPLMNGRRTNQLLGYGCNSSWFNEEFCSTAKPTWPLMDGRRTNHSVMVVTSSQSLWEGSNSHLTTIAPPGSMRNSAPPLNSFGPWWMEGAPISCSVLVVT